MKKTTVAIIQNVDINDHRTIYSDGIARELIKKGFKIDVILQKTKKEHQFKDLPYNLIEIPGDTYSPMGQLKFTFHLFKTLMKFDYYIIHGKNPFSSILIPIILKKLKLKNFKIIYDTRGLWVDFGVHAGYFPKWFLPKIMDFTDIKLMNLCDKIIAISNPLKEILIQRGIEKKKIAVVPEGVDLLKFKSASPIDLSKEYNIRGKVIGYVGSISRARASEKIIEAFKLVHKEKPNTDLIMIGPVNDPEYFNSLIKQYGLDNYVHLTGFIKSHYDILKFIKSFNVAVSFHPFNLPIYNVMVPIKILEYLCAGVPIVASNNISHTSILTNNFDSLLVPQDSKSLSEGILKVLNDKELAKKLSQNARKTAKKYDFEKVAEKVMEVYRACVRN